MLWVAGFFLLTFVLSLAVFCVLIVSLPTRYFAEHRNLWVDRHPVVRWLGIIGKNLLGLLVIVLGIFLSLPGIPGQGLLTIVVGVALLDIPGKHWLIMAVVKRPGVLRNINSLRSCFGRPPMVVDEIRGGSEGA